MYALMAVLKSFICDAGISIRAFAAAVSLPFSSTVKVGTVVALPYGFAVTVVSTKSIVISEPSSVP